MSAAMAEVITKYISHRGKMMIVVAQIDELLPQGQTGCSNSYNLGAILKNQSTFTQLFDYDPDDGCIEWVIDCTDLIVLPVELDED